MAEVFWRTRGQRKVEAAESAGGDNGRTYLPLRKGSIQVRIS